MPSGYLPTYKYKPTSKPGEPEIRVSNSRRARLFEGGTYFRAKTQGLSGNLISVEVLEVTPWNGASGEAYCIVTNRTLNYSENVVGPAEPKILDIKGTYSDLWVIDRLDTNTPRTQYYSISCQIRIAMQNALPYSLPTGTDVGRFTFDKLFTDSGKLAVKAAQDGSILTAGSRIFIAPRTRIYQLSGKSGTDPDTMLPVNGWDIDDLRTQINADNKWIEMINRSGPAPNPGALDVNDEGEDGIVLEPFSETSLSGGDGLPENPNRENTGEYRSLVLVRQGELQNGEMGDHNTMYEWSGDSATAGMWKPY